MKNTALFLPGEHGIQFPHFAPIAIDKYVYLSGVLITTGCRWKFWLLAKPPLIASWLGGLGEPPVAPHMASTNTARQSPLCWVVVEVMTLLP